MLSCLRKLWNIMYWANFLHFYQPWGQQEDIMEAIVAQSYRPILNGIKKNKKIRLTFNINGSLLELFDKYGHRNLIDILRELGTEGKIVFTSSAKYHAFLPFLEEKEIIRKLGQYCFGEGMKYGVLSNGIIWILFRAFQEGTTMAERLVWKVDLENDSISASIGKLATISKDNIGNIETLIKKLQILDEIWQSLLEEPKELIVGLIPVFEKLIKEGYPEYEFASLEIEDFIKEKVRELISPPTETVIKETTPPGSSEERIRPGRMKIGKDVFNISKSYEILTNTANWLIKLRN